MTWPLGTDEVPHLAASIIGRLRCWWLTGYCYYLAFSVHGLYRIPGGQLLRKATQTQGHCSEDTSYRDRDALWA